MIPYFVKVPVMQRQDTVYEWTLAWVYTSTSLTWQTRDQTVDHPEAIRVCEVIQGAIPVFSRLQHLLGLSRVCHLYACQPVMYTIRWKPSCVSWEPVALFDAWKSRG